MNRESKIENKSARILLVDSSASIRQLLSEVFKAKGFENSQAVASVADAHAILETEGADWLVLPLASDQPMNGFHIVRLMSSFPELRGLRVSLLVDQQEKWILPKAFELGLLSYHSKPFTKDTLTAELEELISLFERSDWNATKVSADYLRRYLISAKAPKELLNLESNLLDLFPGQVEHLVHLAQAYAISGQIVLSKRTLKQALFIAPNLKAAIEDVSKELFGKVDLDVPVEDGSSANILGLSRVVIVDSDDASRASVKTVLAELGVTTIDEYADGNTAIGALQSGTEPGLIIMEWKIPKLTGPLLIQRIRSHGFVTCPILVLSALIKPQDMPLVREMGVTQVSAKPIDKSEFTRELVWMIQQDRLPTDQRTIESKIRQFISSKNVKEAETLAAKYLSEESTTLSRKCLISAEISFAKEKYELARDQAMESLKGAPESTFALNVLGKSLMVLRQYHSALKCFQKALTFSPMNLERLIAVAETQAELGETKTATATLAKARDIDPSSPIVEDGSVKVALASKDTNLAKEILGQMNGVGNIIGYLNNKAVAHAKCGLVQEGLEIYRQTIEAIPEAKDDMKTSVIYNSALALVRNQNLSEAANELKKIIMKPDSRVVKKAKSLLLRLEQAIASKSSFLLRDSEHHESIQKSITVPPLPDESIPATVESITDFALNTTRGDLCCYLLFKATEPLTQEYAKITSAPSRFRMRESIVRGETFLKTNGSAETKSS